MVRFSLTKNNIKLKPLLFYTGFVLISLFRMIDRSAIFNMPDYLADVISVFAIIFFSLKILLDKHKRNELLIGGFIIILTLVLKIVFGAPMFLPVSCFAFIAMKGVNIKTVVKIDIAIKAFFLISHALVFAVDYFAGVEFAHNFIDIGSKGTSMSLYFLNSNTTGLIGTWIALDMLYLKDKKKFTDFILPTIIAVATFAITTSRAPMFIYALYLLLQFVKNGKSLFILQKMAYPFLCVFSVLIVLLLAPGNPIYDMLNSMSSGRIWYSVTSYNLVGATILPNMTNMIMLENYVIDIFYVRCLVKYGIVVLGLYYVPHLLVPSDASNEDKRMSIITSVFLFFEAAAADISLVIPYLILASAFYKKEDGINNVH